MTIMPRPDYSDLPDGARWLLDPIGTAFDKASEAVSEAVVGAIWGEETKECLKEARKAVHKHSTF